MGLNKFIFSKTSPSRYYRHIVFWLAMYLSFFLFDLFTFMSYNGFNFSENFDIIRRYQSAAIMSLVLDMLFTYIIVYWVVAEYLAKRKFGRFMFRLVIVTSIAFFIKWRVYHWQFELLFPGQPKIFINMLWTHTIGFIAGGPICRTFLFLVGKMLKNYYEKLEEKIVLIKEKTTAEMQFLKAQVHPHFLFNTLNNIYSLTLNKSPFAGDLVLRLSETVKYMIHDCEARLVPLEKELDMIRDYIGIEKVRYGSRLNLKMSVEGDSKNKFIVPLLIIPFVENSFKHGTSKMLRDPWIQLAIIIEKNHCVIKLKNSKPSNADIGNGSDGIGLQNVQKRLQLAYPSQHQLFIDNTGEMFSVKIQVPLHATN